MPRWRMLGVFIVDALLSLHTYRQVGVNIGLLAIGAMIEHFVHGVWPWFLGFSGIAFLCIIAVAVLILFANGFDMSYDDDSYPDS